MLSVSEILIQLKTFRTEVDSRIKSLELASVDAERSISNAADRLINSLDERVRHLDINDFLDTYDGDMERAVEALATTQIREEASTKQPAASSANDDLTHNKKRKRAGSPSRTASSKRAKGTTTLRLSSQTPLKATGAVRRPRRGESIVLQSANGSPLGSMIAESSYAATGTPTDPEQANQGAEDAEEDWDLLDAAEASRVENIDPSAKGGKSGKKGLLSKTGSNGNGSASKAGGKRGQTKTNSSASQISSKTGTAPTAEGFAVDLPANAPDYAAAVERQARAFKDEWMAKMRQTLAATEMSDSDRQRLEEKLFKDLSV